jgi:hypothetical protein
MKSLFSVFLGCAGVVLVQNVLAQNPQAKQEKAPPQSMSFFVTSVGLGKGADLGGLPAADQHCQMLTGSQADGRAYTDGMDHTCKNWTSSGDGTAQLGHFDRTGGGNTSWNSAHPSRGCSQENLISTGGATLYYCFAVIP